ncbi:MAG: hypothetical protein H0X50_08295 [Nitrosopumilus sp.]|nr:hypothetical protein [Nitrosopumilus sp.]
MLTLSCAAASCRDKGLHCFTDALQQFRQSAVDTAISKDMDCNEIKQVIQKNNGLHIVDSGSHKVLRQKPGC